MLVRQNKLILNLHDPTRLLNLLPSARQITYQGKPLVVVPHRIPETRLLRNLGLAAPHPMETDYDWPIRPGWTPFAHQKETAQFMALHNRCYCFDEMGTGKTMSALWAFDYLRKAGIAKKMLVVTPMSTMERTWADEVFIHFPHLTCVVVHGSRGFRRTALATDVDIYIINHDGVKTVQAELEAMAFDVVLIDEVSQAARNEKTDRWKALSAVIAKRPTVWGMTGTPTPNAPTDAWAQCRLITPHTVPPFFSHFQDQTMRQHAFSAFKWIARPNALEIVHQVMQPAIRHRREDVIDLPPTMYETRQTPLTKEQSMLYKQMMDKLAAEARGKTLTAANEAVKVMKLVQIAAGATRSDDGVLVSPPKHRLIALKEVIEEAATKVIVYVPFRAPLDMIATILSKGFTVEQIHGGVSKKDRDRIFGEFQHGKDPQVLVAQPAAMSHGLTLTAASVVTWFAPVNSAEIYEQANARITRPGQKHSQLIIHLQGSPIEALMYQRLKEKTTMQGVLLNMFK